MPSHFAKDARTFSTFSCDTAYPSSPAALRASERSRYTRLSVMRPLWTVTTCVLVSSIGAPLALPLATRRWNTTTRWAASMKRSGSKRNSDQASRRIGRGPLDP
jgi:hypothetical protein